MLVLPFRAAMPVDTQRPLAAMSALNHGLAAWWLTVPQLAGGQRWYDLSAGCDGVLTNMDSASGWRSTTRPGGMGHVLFDGANDLVRLPLSSRHKPPTITVAGWARQDAPFPAVVYGVEYRSDGTGLPPVWSLKLGFHNDLAQFRVAVNGVARQAFSPALPIGQWNHLMGTYDGTTVRIFVNGRQVGTFAATGSLDWGTSADGGIGRSIYSPMEPLHGAIDDVRVWSRALTANDVADVYTDSMTGYVLSLRRCPLPLPFPATHSRPWLFQRRPSILGSGVI